MATQLVVLEGRHLLEEAMARGHRLESVFAVPALAAELAEQLAPDVPLFVVEPTTLAGAIDTVSPQGVAAIAPRPSATVEDIDLDAGVVLVLAGIADPGNAGTLIRSAEAAGAAGVILTRGSVDPFSPKALRASAGAALGLAVVEGGDPSVVLDQLAGSGARRLGAVAGAGEPYDAAVFTGRLALVVGHEAHGLDDAAMAAVDGLVHVPMAGKVESLNVGVAGSVLLFEIARARRAGSG
jgi:TrmH family RNA methyltransferase